MKAESKDPKTLSRRGFIAGAATLAVGGALAGCTPSTSSSGSGTGAAAQFTAGTYTGEGQGRNGAIVTEVVFTETEIVSAKITDHRETEHIGTWALEKIPAAFVNDQHLSVDVVSGATLSSLGVTTALLACVEQAGGDKEAISAPVEPEVFENDSCDVVVVGGGGAGLTAAAELATLGLDVIMIEKTGILGGTTVTASTYIPGYGTKSQKEQGNTVTAEDFLKTVSSALREDDLATAQHYVEIVPETLEKLVANGADLSRTINGLTQLGPSDGGTIGAEIIPAAINILESSKAEYRLEHKLSSLLTEGDAVVGALVETKGGTYEIKAKAVVMAFGGYISNPEMVKLYNPEYVDLGSTWSVGSTGEGLQMCIDLGADVGGMEAVVINPTGYAVGGSKIGMMSFSNFRYNGCILVARSTGLRFADELDDYTAIAKAMPQSEAYAIFDQKVMDSSVTIQEYYELGYFEKGETIEELAEKLNLDAAVLKTTIETYSEYAQSGTDAEFGRESMLSDLATSPYYAAPVEPALHNAVGGIISDSKGRVLGSDGTAIAGLYVAGNAADNTYLPNATAGCMIYPRVIAQAVVEDRA